MRNKSDTGGGNTFQFQYGAIKRRCKRLKNWFTGGFQFQYGAIKRKIERPTRRIFTYFNSNMVRLKVGAGRQKAPFGGISIPIWCD